jgi:hypothetical protein
MQATTSGRMANQPTVLAAGAALVIATTVMVAAVASQNVRFGNSSATRPVPASPQQIERSLAQVRAGEHEGLTRGWATGQGKATVGYPLPDKRDGHVGLTELAAGGITSGTASELPVGNWGLSEVRPNGSTDASQIPYAPYITSNLPAGNWGLNQVRTPEKTKFEVAIPAGAFAPGVPSLPVLKPVGTSDAVLSPSSPSYSELINQRKGEKYRLPKTEQPDAFNRAGASIR